MNRPIRILYVDDYPLDRELVRDVLEKEHGGFVLVEAASRSEFEKALAQGSFDLVLSDFNILGFEGLQVLEIVHSKNPNLPVIIVTGTGSEEVAAESIKRGAADYVLKTPRHIQRLPHTIHTVLEQKQLENERRKIEEALRKSESKWRSLVMTIPDYIALHDVRGNYLFLNHYAKGFSEKDILGKTAYDFIPPESQPVFKSHFTQCVEAKTTQLFEFKGFGDLQTTCIYENYLIPILEKDRVVNVLSIARDITERKKVDVQLKRQSALINALLNSSRETVLLLDKEGKILNINRSGAKNLGLKPMEAIGKNAFALIPEPTASLRKKIVTEVMQTGRPAQFEDNRNEKFFLNSVYPVNDPETGSLMGAAIYALDITNRRQAEDALRESETRFRSLFRNMLNGFAYCKMIFKEGKPQDFIYLEVNGAFETLTGLKNVAGKKVSEVIPGIQKSDPEIFDLYGRVATSGKPETAENYVRNLDMWFSISVYSPQKGYFVAVFDVITQRKKIEAELELLARFPAENPNSMMRVSQQNRLIFANKSSAPILRAWKIKKSDLVPVAIQKEIALAVKTQKPNVIEFTCGKHTFSFVLVAIPTHEYVNMYGRDITERIQAEKALHESENQLSQIYNNVSDVIFVLAVEPNNNFRFISVNKRFLEVTGVSEKRVIGKPYQEVIPKPAQALVLGNYKKAILTKKTVAWEEISAYPTGIKIGEVYVTPVFDEKGKCTQLIGMVHDITSRRQTEETIRISEARYRNLIDSQSDIISRSDPNGILTFVNDAYCETFGKSREQLLGLSFIPTVFPEDRKLSEEAIEKVKHPPYRSQSETRHITPGGVRWFSWENSAMVDENDKVTELQGVGRDISKTKQAQLKFQQRNEDLALLAAISEALNRGESLSVIISLISAGFKRTFNGNGVSVFLSSTDRRKLKLQYIPVSSILLGRIEKLVGLSVTHLEFDFEKIHLFQRIIESRKPFLINDSVGLQKIFLAFAQAAIPNEKKLAHVKNILPALQKMIGLKSAIIVPLFSENELVGVLEIGSRGSFTEEDLNRITAFSGQLTSVIKRKSAEEALLKSEESFRNLFENSTVGLYRTTPDGEILLANPALVKMLGYESFEELTKRNLEKEGFEPGYARREFKKRVENDSFIQGLEIVWKKKDGTEIFVRESSKAIRDAGGKVQYYEGTIEDVTKRKRAEQELARSAQELHARNVDLERFNKAAVGRELRMIELKKKINELSIKCGQPAPYSVSKSVESKSSGS
jgi:PAS domain S-box-containing protein